MSYSTVSKKSGKTYYLHSRTNKPGGTPLYFFAGEVKAGAIDELPAGMTVVENARTGLPMLKRQ